MWLNGEDLRSPALDLLRQQKKFPSLETCKVWIRQFTTHGHIDPKRATGNHRAERELRGEWLVRLAIYCTVNPKATIDETRAYLYNLQPQNNQHPPFSLSQIYRAEQLLQLLWKVGSTTCCRAYLPINLTKREMYFTWGEPFGIADTPIQDVVDLDEAGIKLEHSN